MNETLKQDYQNRFDELTNKLQTLRDRALDLSTVLYSFHGVLDDLLCEFDNTLDQSDKFLKDVDSIKNLAEELNLIADMLKEKQNEL